MKKFIPIFLCLCLFVMMAENAVARKSVSRVIYPEDLGNKPLLKEAVTNYNENRRVNESSKAGDKFFTEFKKHLKTMVIDELWKAELVGETIYLKSGKKTVAIQIVEIKNENEVTIKIAGREVTLNMTEGFEKNYEAMKKAFAPQSSFLDLILPRAHAGDTKQFEEELSSITLMAYHLVAVWKSENDKEQDRICALNEAEKSKFPTYFATAEVRLAEIKYLVRAQNKRTKPGMTDLASEVNVCRENCEKSKKFQTCIQELAERRQQELARSGHYFTCFKKYEDGYLYLNSEILHRNLNDREKSPEEEAKAIAEDKRWGCGSKFGEEQKRCYANIEARKNACPQDKNSAAVSRKSNNTSSSKAGSR